MAMSNQAWWPNQLNLKILRQNSPLSDPMGNDGSYAKAFKTLDVDALKKDVEQVMRDAMERRDKTGYGKQPLSDDAPSPN